jgi:GT2 family glycosyltransferase/glycosyltransferase involved in cell wall biosynthesis/tetratricopeptide (TPR) repeat protein
MKSVQSQPDSAKTHSAQEWLTSEAVTRHKAGDLEAAISYYLQVIDVVDQVPAWIYGNTITLLAKVERSEEAIALGQQALAEYPTSDEIYRAVGIAAVKQGNDDQSINYFSQALEINPEQPVWVYYQLTELLTKKKALDKAIAVGNQGLELNPDSHWLHYYLGEALSAKREWDQAISTYIRSLELKSDFPSAAQGLDQALENRQENRQLEPENNTEIAIAPVAPVASVVPVITSGSRVNTRVNTVGKITAKITGVFMGGALQGWAIDRQAPNQAIKFKLLIDHQAVKTFTTDRLVSFDASDHGAPDLADLAGAGLADSLQGFEVKLPIEFLDDQEHLIELVPLTGNHGEAPAISFSLIIPRRGFGVIDLANNNRLRGWALPDGHTTGAAKLDVYIDDVFYSEIQANLPRPDLHKQGWGNGNNGYDLLLPLSDNPHHTYKIAVVFSGTQQHLKRSPIEAIGNLPQNSVSNSIFAQVTEVALGGILTGWAIDQAHSDRPVKLKILVDGQAIGVVETTTVYEEIPDRSLTAAPRKFQLQLPLDLLDEQEHLIALVPVGTSQANPTPISARMVIPRRGFGVLEAWTNNCLHGWVLPDGHHGAPASLDVYLDGIFYQEVRANLPRPDLVKHGISAKGENGYKIPLPIPPAAKTEYQVEIFFKGTKQHLKKSPRTITYDQGTTKETYGHFSQLYSAPQPNLQQVTIVIPVYNAHDAVRQCLISVFKHTSRAAQLIIINDASPDERIQPMLAAMVADRPNVRLIMNEENLGYTRTINKAISLAPQDDIILLNSDTAVGPRWLENMRIAAYQDRDIGTVTAISDNSGAFSVPQMGQANDFPEWLQPEEIARMIHQQSSLIYPETPTGSGFCLYIRRELMNDIGLFDEEAFPRGYGEENDFCMRGLRAGWRHIVDDRTLVYHVRSASFQGEKTALYQPGRAVVDRRYPEYKALVTHFVHSPPMDLMRYQIRKLLENSSQLAAPRPRVLFVISTKTGGTPQTNQDLMTGLGDRYHPMLLVCDSREISFYDARPEEHVLLESVKLRSPINPTSHTSKEYDNIVGDLLFRYGIELVHIRHIAWHSLSLARLAKRLDIPTILSFHDFYTICPTVNLLDENQVFCGGECTATEGRCPLPIWSEHRIVNLKHDFIKTWQHNMAKMFQYIDAFVTTAPSAKEMMVKTYPQLAEANFKVIPHGRDFPHLENEPTFILRPPKSNQPLRVLFPGNISSSKGAELIVQIKKLDVNNRLEFHFLGRTRHFLTSVGRIHGTYTRNDFDQWMQKIRPHCVGIFSIWPETYCHTLTESWASGVPVVAINKGAVGERIARHGGGWLIDEVDPEAVYQRLLAIADDADGYIEKISHLNRWQLTYVRQNNIATMAAQYHQLYQQVFHKSRPFTLGSEANQTNRPNYQRVGVFINEQRPPTAHIRVLEWLQHPEICDRLDVQFLEIDTFLNDHNRLYDLDVVLIQRNILQPHHVQPLIDACRDRQLPIVYEIDDNLLQVPADKDLTGIYARSAPAIATLAAAAAEVIVSTEPLATQMRQFNDRVTVMSNVIAEATWLKPITPEVVPSPLSNLSNLPTDTFKVLYMGNSSHREDLAMIKTVFERLAQSQVKVRLLVIGGESETAENAPDWYTRISVPQGYESYQLFVPWFRTVAAECNLAIAPLVANEFNQYKSPLKFLQYSAVGLPAIYSQVTPYQEVVNHGVDGILVDNDPEAWYQAIVQCLNHQENLTELANAAQKKVREQYLMANFANAYVEIFARALSTIN